MLRKNSLCVVTGGSAGIGKELSFSLLKQGHRVVIIDKEDPGYIIKVYSGKAWWYVADLSMVVSQSKAITDIVESHEEVPQLLINNAGIGENKPLTNSSSLRTLGRVNLEAPIHLACELTTHLKEANLHGHIVNVSSGQVFFKLPTWGAYTATKSALAAASEAMHHELKPYNICVTTVYPFMVNTGFYDDIKNQQNTLGGRLAMKLLPWYSYSPRTVSNQILRGVRKHKREVMCSPVNHIGRYLDLIPGAGALMRKLANAALNKKEL